MTLTKAQLFEISWSEQGDPEVPAKPRMTVQFNPASLKVSYSNQVQTNGNNTSSSMQSVGKGDSKLAVELLFDVSGVGAEGIQDVRQLTKEVAYFMKTTPESPPTDSTAGGSSSGTSGGSQQEQRYRVAGMRFLWGSFFFDGILVSMDETLDLWSEDGRPLRATVTMNLSQPGIHFADPTNSSATRSPKGGTQAGTAPLTAAPQGATLQDLVSNAGIKADWKAIAAANGIENPRQLTPGSLVNLKVPASPPTAIRPT